MKPKWFVATGLYCWLQFRVHEDVVNHFASRFSCGEVGFSMTLEDDVLEGTVCAESGQATGFYPNDLIEVARDYD